MTGGRGGTGLELVLAEPSIPSAGPQPTAFRDLANGKYYLPAYSPVIQKCAISVPFPAGVKHDSRAQAALGGTTKTEGLFAPVSSVNHSSYSRIGSPPVMIGPVSLEQNSSGSSPELIGMISRGVPGRTAFIVCEQSSREGCDNASSPARIDAEIHTLEFAYSRDECTSTNSRLRSPTVD